jgi:hypothetical protein
VFQSERIAKTVISNNQPAPVGVPIDAVAAPRARETKSIGVKRLDKLARGEAMRELSHS